GLHGDDRYLAIDDLTDEESGRVADARTLCRCGMCTMLRPDDPATIHTLCRDLLQADPTSATTPASYLSGMHQGRADVLVAMINAGPVTGEFRSLAEKLERYVGRVPDAWPLLQALLPDLEHPVSYDLALSALGTLHRLGDPAATSAHAWFR